MKKEHKIIVIALILIIFLSAGKVAASLVTSAANISLSSDKTSKTKVSEALNELYDMVSTPSGCPDGWTCIPPIDKICKRATVLHSITCYNSSYGCSTTVGYGKTITYGNLGTTGTLTTGDAFDCDVNGDGKYDKDTERFYYVSDLWTGGTSFNSSWAVLIYYSNTIINGDTITQDYSTGKAYHQQNYNYQGPDSEYLSHIPNKKEGQWKMVNLSSTVRQIYNENGGNTAGGVVLPQYVYSNKAARLITIQEIQKACNITIGSYTEGDLKNCTYLLENTYFERNNRKYGYYLENPYSADKYNVWSLNGHYLYIRYGGADGSYSTGVRPVIEVLKSDMDY